ncbi:hypothetical protein ACFQMA_12825 [Halosimplex aquaticum]|uniref:Uncharacterized protein n=1 Tax=Halosimplex aquaticum TaxID=3026162 RepID=A0ABD5Y057_9EURY|nr:hypothetical protein [Halosimplex aquaticum]
MDPTLDGVVMRATVVLLVAGLCLVTAGTAGLGGSLPLAFALAVVGAGLYLVATTVDAPADGLGVREVATDLWTGPLLAAVVVLVWLEGSPGEIQALGGLVGLVGMLNYFLRPLYHLVYGAVGRVANA